MTPQVLILNSQIDLYALEHVEQLIDISESKTFQKSKLLDNKLSLQVKNFDDFFSIENPKSIFSGINYLYQPFVIIDSRGVTIWDGIITDIKRNHANKKATIESQSYVSKWNTYTVEYNSSDWETPASAIKNIFTAYSYTQYDAASLQQAIDTLTDNSCLCKVHISKSDNLTFFQAIEKLSEYACAYAYTSKGKIFVKHYSSFSGGVSITINEKDIIDPPSVHLLSSDITNDYSIGYDGDQQVSVTDATANNIASVSRTRYETHSLPEMNSSGSGQITFKDAVSATYIGECYINRSHYKLSTNPRPLYQIDFSIPYRFLSYVDLGTYFYLNFSDEGWTNKIFETFSIKTNIKTQKINITAVEVNL